MLLSYLLAAGLNTLFGLLVVTAFHVAPRTTVLIMSGVGLVFTVLVVIMVVISDPAGALVWGMVAVIAGVGVPLALLALAVWAKGKRDPTWKADHGWAAQQALRRDRFPAPRSDRTPD